jgi:hypothetical protein
MVFYDTKSKCFHKPKIMKPSPQSSSTPFLLAILAAYGTQEAAFIRHINGILAGLGCKSHLLIVRNDLSQSAASAAGTVTTTISGDNAQFEFSAWQAGITSEVARGLNPDVFLLMTTTFLNAGYSSMPVFSLDVIRRLCAGKGMAGRVRKLPCHVPWQNTELQSYIQTHLVLLHRDTVSALGSVVSVKSPDVFIHPRFSSHPFTDHNIWAHGFDDYLFHMLTQRWHGHGMPYTEANYPFFRRKVLSILNELVLTARVRALNHPILNLTPLPWLFDSPWLLPFPGRPIALAQVIRNAIFRIITMR